MDDEDDVPRTTSQRDRTMALMKANQADEVQVFDANKAGGARRGSGGGHGHHVQNGHVVDDIETGGRRKTLTEVAAEKKAKLQERKRSMAAGAEGDPKLPKLTQEEKDRGGGHHGNHMIGTHAKKDNKKGDKNTGKKKPGGGLVSGDSWKDFLGKGVGGKAKKVVVPTSTPYDIHDVHQTGNRANSDGT